MTQTLRLGSLFDGSGGFPLAATKVGIEPVWASEIEPFPILVTTTRLPQMQHLGNICNIDGSQLEPVDVVTFGSPCQDLSVAGKRAGLAGERSGLFHQAVRVIREMRKASHGLYPRFAVWENVPGAFSSNKGADFHSVLQNLISVVDETAAADLPRVQKWHKLERSWQTNGVLRGEYWTRNFSEYPNDAKESTLSAILQAGVPDKYSLSPNACSGILRRAAVKGKTLPPILEQALTRQANL